MGETESIREGLPAAAGAQCGAAAGAGGELSPVLAEAAAGLPGATERLIELLTSHLKAQLETGRHTLASAASMRPSDAVQALWHELAHAEQPEGPPGCPVAAPEAPEAPQWPDALYRVYMQHAVRVMHSLVLDAVPVAAGAAWNQGDAGALLSALQALERLEPQLAHKLQLRWFGGLGVAEIARLLGESEDQAERHWHKARAFVAAALEPGQAAVSL